MVHRQRIRILIVDDEAPGRQRLEELLQDEPECEIVAVAETGEEAVGAIRSLRPDLVFLDVQMPGKTGIDVVNDIGTQNMPATVFVTAYNAYALQAFDLHAIDYLLKPFDDERFERALRRARRLIELDQVRHISDELLTRLVGQAAASPSYAERLTVNLPGQVRIIPVDQIEYVTASGPYIEVHTGEKVHVMREEMHMLEERLDPGRFMRIHRSAIVRLDRIELLVREGHSDYSVRLKGGAQLNVSRKRIEQLERWMGVRPVPGAAESRCTGSDVDRGSVPATAGAEVALPKDK